MTQNQTALIKFVAPPDLKAALERLAGERNIALSALLRLIVTEYIRQKGGT